MECKLHFKLEFTAAHIAKRERNFKWGREGLLKGVGVVE